MLRTIALVSGIYDVAVGASLLAGRPLLLSLFELPAPVPPIHADLNALFVTAVGIGYWWPYRDPVRYRWYLWLMGAGLKGAGAAVFVADYLLRGSPRSFLVFALSDGALAAATLLALLWNRGRP
ncbi:MAG: hypothetical protein ACRD26_00690 [Vicinamibacterales bacterium]